MKASILHVAIWVTSSQEVCENGPLFNNRISPVIMCFICNLSITTNVSSNLTLGEVYSIQHVIVFSDLQPVGDFPDFSTNKTDHHNVTEMLLKVAFSTITLTLSYENYPIFYPKIDNI